MVLYLIEFIRNMFEGIPWKVSLLLLYIEQICRFLAYVGICSYFLKSAANLVGKKRVKKWRQFINIFIVVVMTFLMGLLCSYIYHTINPQGKNRPDACKSYEFII
jgi:NADH:ubiquinone oxidoreductase subunit 6 (subunit J)